MTREDSGCEQLLDLALPGIYRKNLFRVLGLPVNATPRDVQRRENRRKMQNKLGIAGSSGSGVPLAIDPPPTEEDLRAALERLHRPMDRLLDEVMWFWPTNGDPGSDPALKALNGGDLNKATSIWEDLAGSYGLNEIALHNLAVLDHLTALDIEHSLDIQNANRKELKRLNDLWLRVFERWKLVLDGEEFWSAVRSRIQELDDARLTTGLSRRIKETMPSALLLINAKIAFVAAEKSEDKQAKRQLDLIARSGFGDGYAEQAIDVALAPIRKRIKTITETAESRWISCPQKGDRYVRELHDHAKKLLASVDILLAPDNVTRIGLHDTVAEKMLLGQIEFANKTNEWDEALRLLELAKEIAAGESLRSRLEENLEIVANNSKSGNSWCAPGYWDLPKGTIEELEAIREVATSGNYDRAIRKLLSLDSSIGQPLRRSLAHCLMQNGIEIINNGLQVFDTPVGVLKKVLDKVSALGGSMLLMNQPDPYQPAYTYPPCPACGRTGYTQWSTFSYNNVSMFVCAVCGATYNNELERKRVVLRKEIQRAYSYMALADEVDPGNPNTKENLKIIKKTANTFDCSLSGHEHLKEELSEFITRRIKAPQPRRTEDGVCHFCTQNTPDEACGITVPMLGDLNRFSPLIGEGVECRTSVVTVPRCKRCRDEHRELPARLEKWTEARHDASVSSNFPELVNRIEEAEREKEKAGQKVASGKEMLDRALDEIAEANKPGEKCPKCGSTTNWKDYVCDKCDAKEVGAGALKTMIAIGFALASLAGILVINGRFSLFDMINGFFFKDAEASQASHVFPITISAIVPVSVGILVGRILTRSNRARRRELTRQREVEFARSREKAVRFAEEKAGKVQAELEKSKGELESRRSDITIARKELREAQDEATRKFESINPRPALPVDILPETEYTSYVSIAELRSKGWGFGTELRGQDSSPETFPVDISGLVSRVPRSIDELRCKSSPTVSGNSSRDAIKNIVGEAGEEDYITCHFCTAEVKAKNYLKHYIKMHEGDQFPETNSHGQGPVSAGVSEENGKKHANSGKIDSSSNNKGGKNGDVDTSNCLRCGNRLQTPRALMCLYCGMKWFKCAECGSDWPRGGHFCENCGTHLKDIVHKY